MKSVIALVLVCVGLGVDANGSQNLEIALGLCFFFGAVNLARPAVSVITSVSSILLPVKQAQTMKGARR